MRDRYRQVFKQTVCVSEAFCLRAATVKSHISCFSLYVRTEGVMRTMTVEKLLKGMPTLQSQIDALLDFDVSDTR